MRSGADAGASAYTSGLAVAAKVESSGGHLAREKMNWEKQSMSRPKSPLMNARQRSDLETLESIGMVRSHEKTQRLERLVGGSRRRLWLLFFGLDVDPQVCANRFPGPDPKRRRFVVALFRVEFSDAAMSRRKESDKKATRLDVRLPDLLRYPKR